jgi:xylulokinase
MAGIFLSADIGTTSLKASIIDQDGRLMAFSRIAYPANPGEKTGAALWERAFALALEDLYAQAPGAGIDGVCVSGNGPTMVPVSHDGDAMPPLFWNDGRTVPPPPQIAVNEAPSFFLPHAAWLKKNAPDLYDKTGFFISSHEWLAFRLGTGIFTVLPSMRYEPYYWDDKQCLLFGLDREKFPPFITMGKVMGSVSREAASFLGPYSGNRLKSGTPVIAGGPDFITALIGTRTQKPGDVCDRAGSSEGINVCAAVPLKTDGLRVLPHVNEGLWNAGMLIPSSGALFEWYRNYSGCRNMGYGELLAELIPSSEDTEAFAGDFFFPPGESVADECPVSPIKETALGRAVLCAIGFAVRGALEILEARGLPVTEMRVSGGQAKNRLWNQLKADITGRSLLIPEIPDGELAGNAVLAAAALETGSGAGETGFEAALERTDVRMIRFREIFQPRKANASFWEQRYGLYKNRKNSS